METNSPDETEAFASRLARALPIGSVLGLEGELGAGKTCFTRGFVAALAGADETHVSSPTFALLNIYRTAPPVYHFDLYRLVDFDDLESAGFWDVIERADGLTVIEWCGRIAEAKEACRQVVSIEALGETRRRLSVATP